jgi:hypothetical protein
MNPKRAALVIVSLAAVAAAAFLWPRQKVPEEPGYSEQLVYALEQMRHVTSIGGYSTGLGGRPHSFYLLSLYARRVAGEPEIELMLRDRSASVRVAGAVAFVERRGLGMNKQLLDPLLLDHARVTILNDCQPQRLTVAEIVAGLQADRGFLGLIDERPNPPPEPPR